MFPKIKIVADSSADTLSLEGVEYSSVPLKIITADKEYTDNEALDVVKMAEELSQYKGKSSTACPSPSDWLESFADSDYVFCVTITSALSGSYNSACIAKRDYEAQHPNRSVFVIDTLSAGPGLRLVIEKLKYYILENLSFDAIKEKITKYLNKTEILFVLESMKNLANNGRVNPLAAKAAGFLGIRAIGRASDKGEIQLLEKVRGAEKSLAAVVRNMKSMQHIGGKVRISHCNNLVAALQLKEMILNEFKNSVVEIYPIRALCAFYTEKGGLLVGFEKNCI